MCGITGILSFNMVGRMHLVHLEDATKMLSRRGPDAHGTWFDDRVGLGHRRLSIIDLSEESNQPFFDDTKRFALVYNGEVYNYRALREQLIGLGCTFRTTSDTEVILTAFKVWGDACFEKFNGFFGMAIYDRDKKCVTLARDRFGIKPLYYFRDGDKFIFGSELKALIAFNIPRTLDKASLHQYLQLTYVPDQFCMLEGVQKLAPGKSLTVSEGDIKEQSFYTLATSEANLRDLSSAKADLRKLMYQAVERRLVSDVPLGAFLSGGIDSSVISAIAAELNPGLLTFSVGFSDNKYFDETHYAQLVAKKIKAEHTVFSLSNDDLLAHYDDVVSYFSEPFADSSAIPFYILSKLTKGKITVALSGDGADEIFSGYNKHEAWIRSEQRSRLNTLLRVTSPFWRMLPKSRNTWLTDKVRQLHKYAQLLHTNGNGKYWHLAAFNDRAVVDGLLVDPVGMEGLEDRCSEILDGYGGTGLNEVLRADMALVLPGDMLRKVDLMSMAHGLEVRVPFLDHEVVDYAFGLDDTLKLSGGQRKRVLKETFRDLLPEELYGRPKHGFEVPLLKWLRNDLRNELAQFVFERERIESQQLFRWDMIRKLQRKLHSFDPGDSPSLVWSLYVFQRWYSRYMEA